MQERPTKRFWKAYGALYGDGAPEQPKQKTKTPPKPPNRPESHEQIIFINWLRQNNIPAFHVPNGGKRDIAEAAWLKKQGVEPGVPDIFIPVMRKGHGGLFIEMKRKNGGKLSEHQARWRDLLSHQGYAWFEAHGADAAIEFVKAYMT